MERLEKLREKLAEKKLGGIFLHQRENVLYLTGFTGSTGGAYITQEHAWVLVDSRYTEQAGQQCPDFEIVPVDRPWYFQSLVKDETTVGFEEDDLTVAIFEEMKEKLPNSVSLVPGASLVKELRMYKDPEELEKLQRAVDIADDAFHHILPFIKEGVMEVDIANELDFYMRTQGATGPSFDFIVASGERSALPHGVASRKKLEPGEAVLMDYGCIFENYCSDMTRTVFLGDPGPEMQQLYHIVKEGQARAYRNAIVGKPLNGPELAVRSYFEQLELEQYFGHSLGHGVGIEIHEMPFANRKATEKFRPGMVFTIEPGLYIPNGGGVRIEDMVYMTYNGPHTMTGSPKELIIL
ncbi:MAG: Xaa-Pro peptidase family protein [Bacillota bacterium]|nr:Xaa-Pro peptidase family protein [Bacillota bacterium]